MSQVVLNGISVVLGGNTILRDVTFTITRGDRWGVVGRNGSGKTTLINAIAGRLEISSGSIARASGLRVTLLDQHRETGADLTVWEAAALPFARLMQLERSIEHTAVRIGELAEHTPQDLLARYDHDLERFAREGGYTYASRVDAVLQGLGFEPASARTRGVSGLSGGEAGRLALARQLVAPADLLLLDEPTNHLDLETTSWLEQYLGELDASVLVISHDRAFLENVTGHTLHLENGTTQAYRGGYGAFVRQHAERQLAQERAFSAQQRAMAAEEDYIRRNIAGQNSRQAKGRRKRLARVERLSPPPTEERVMALRIQPADGGGDQVLIADDVALRIGERVLLRAFSTRVTRGEVIGLVGANGAGKSTLLSAIAGQRPVDGGTLRVGAATRLAYYRQDLTQVPFGKSLFDIIHDLRPQWQRGAVQSHLGRFGFSGAEVQRTADTLSGGERARVALAMLVLAEAHFLLLDEPTNHLDVESIEALEDALDVFDGTVLLVSHDRELLRNTVERVWLLESERIADFNGTFEVWETERAAGARRDAEESAQRKAAQHERERGEKRKRAQSTAAERAAARALRAAIAEAEAEVHALEMRAASLRQLLEDSSLYVDAAGARRAGEVKKELDDVEELLVLAIEKWTNSVEARDSAATPLAD